LPNGFVACATGDVHQPLRLPGQSAEQFDMGANGFSPLSYNNARWYQPTWGQYTQPDPLGFAGSPTNLYAYANNDPLALIDPSGLDDDPVGAQEFVNTIAGFFDSFGLIPIKLEAVPRFR
jgi:RHS repeat-associated protein